MDIRTILFSISGVLSIVALIPYIRAILAGKTKPTKATWIIWGLLDIITISGMLSRNSLNNQMVGATIGAWIVAGLSLKYGMPGWSKLDKFCLGSAIFGVILWQVFNSPELSIIISLAVMFIGSIPTFVSAWRDPSRENRTAWTIFWVSSILAVVAIPSWTIAKAAQPLVFLTNGSIVMYILYIRPRIK